MNRLYSFRRNSFSGSHSSDTKRDRNLCKDCRRLDIEKFLSNEGEFQQSKALQPRTPKPRCPLCQICQDAYNQIFNGACSKDPDGRFFDSEMVEHLAECDAELDAIAESESWKNGVTISPARDYLGPYFAIKWHGAKRTEVRLRPLKLIEESLTEEKRLSFNSNSSWMSSPGDIPDEPDGVIEGSQLSTGLVRKWLWKCTNTDGERCNSRLIDDRYNEPIDLILIDVIQGRLVQSQSQKRYLTLSYSWGNVQGLQTTRSNFRVLQQPGAISSNRVDLPLTVQDAIKFTLSLDIRYLWIDRLCIVQDDADYKHRQIERMDIVYSHAYMTIVAASGASANAGLPGVRPGSRGIPAYPVIALGGVPFGFLRSRPTFQSALSSSHVRTRAWTFQERLLARRCLYFFTEQVFFYCNSAFEAEAFGAPEVDFSHKGYRVHEANPLHRLRRTEESYHAGRWDKDFTPFAYRRLVEEYTASNLSYPEDILDAFAGLAAVLRSELARKGHSGVLLHGIPEHKIENYLLWFSRGDMTRRSPPRFPSWAWAGWVGGVAFLNTENSEGKILCHKFGYILTEEAIGHIKSEIAQAQRIGAKPLEEDAYAISIGATFQNSLSWQKVYVSYINTDWSAVQGMLHFVARAINASAVAPGYLGNRDWSIPTTDDRNRYGHILMNETIHAEQWNPSLYDLVILSQMHDVYNIMLVLWKGDFAVRFGVGVFEVSAWPRAHEVLKHIILD